jgi:GDP-4-dehydro-6-deoxy-D-mannose reductase
VRAVIARVFNHFGTGQPTHFVFSDWCRQIVLAELGLKKPVLEVGNLDALRDFLHVEDVVRAYEILISRGRAGGIYNICHGQTRSLTDYVKFLLSKARIPLKVEVRKNRLRRGDPPIMKGESRRLRKLGWKPEFSPFMALEDLLNEWRKKVQSGVL